MASTSFAIGSVSVAIVWGTFFYPPPPQRTVDRANVAPVAVEVPPAAAQDARISGKGNPLVSNAIVTSLESPPALMISSTSRLAAKP